jgi:2,4-dienoyl-CoA reductase-like NADH-dependent reductase (Old Yellow Enzyme family)
MMMVLQLKQAINQKPAHPEIICMNDAPSAVLNQPLTLPCGVVLKNRLCKSAMSENLAPADHGPDERFCRLYETWALGGVGLGITGNVMVDETALGEPNNVVIADDRHIKRLHSWASAGTQNNTQLWVQLNHPGKQVPKSLSRVPVAPSAIPFSGKLAPFFNPPRELTTAEIETIIHRFANAAGIVKEAGFTGVQIHGAHGYLVSQFLSPRHNQRRDAWGGSLENRMRFLLEIYRAIRAAVGPLFPVGIKLNSSDFSRDGFTEEESAAVVISLAAEGIDLVEISGGTYEKPVMSGREHPKRVLTHEAYFISHAENIRRTVDIPLVITGGFRTARGMASAIRQNGVDLVGLARPLAIDPHLPEKIFSGMDYVSPVKPLLTGVSYIDKLPLLEVTWYEQQLAFLAGGQSSRPDRSVWLSLGQTLFENGLEVFRRRRA